MELKLNDWCEEIDAQAGFNRTFMELKQLRHILM